MFNSDEHRALFQAMCPGKLLTDAEWIAPVYVLTSDNELRFKAAKHIKPAHREIEWEKIMQTDFGSGHRAALYWAFALWAGNSWRYPELVDTMDKAFYMDHDLRVTVTYALMLRWKLQTVKI